MTRLDDNKDHGGFHTEDCLSAVIERYEDGTVWCPWLWSGGTCEECMEIWEKNMRRDESSAL